VNDRFLGLLGLAQRAGAVSSGSVACEQSLKKGKAKLIIVADDAALEVKNEYAFLAGKAGISFLTVPSKFALGAAIGKSQRVAVVVTDDGFARRLQELH